MEALDGRGGQEKADREPECDEALTNGCEIRRKDVCQMFSLLLLHLRLHLLLSRRLCSERRAVSKPPPIRSCCCCKQLIGVAAAATAADPGMALYHLPAPTKPWPSNQMAHCSPIPIPRKRERERAISRAPVGCVVLPRIIRSVFVWGSLIYDHTSRSLSRSLSLWGPRAEPALAMSRELNRAVAHSETVELGAGAHAPPTPSLPMSRKSWPANAAAAAAAAALQCNAIE